MQGFIEQAFSTMGKVNGHADLAQGKGRWANLSGISPTQHGGEVSVTRAGKDGIGGGDTKGHAVLI